MCKSACNAHPFPLWQINEVDFWQLGMQPPTADGGSAQVHRDCKVQWKQLQQFSMIWDALSSDSLLLKGKVNCDKWFWVSHSTWSGIFPSWRKSNKFNINDFSDEHQNSGNKPSLQSFSEASESMSVNTLGRFRRSSNETISHGYCFLPKGFRTYFVWSTGLCWCSSLFPKVQMVKIV